MTELMVDLELLWVTCDKHRLATRDVWKKCSVCDGYSDFYLYRHPEDTEYKFDTVLSNKRLSGRFSLNQEPALVLCFGCFGMTFVDDPRVIADTYYNTTSPYYKLTVRPQPRNKKAPF
jgi:hypothetical protein